MLRTPRITDPDLLARLALDTEGLQQHMLRFLAGFAPRERTPELADRGLRYPWHRPTRPYVLRDGEATVLDDLDAAARDAVLERFASPDSRRIPLLAFGSNAAPRPLHAKLDHFDEPADREVLVLSGDLHDLDVVAVPVVTVYGAMPATLAASPGTAVRAAVLLVTEAQLTQLTWSELTYWLGRLDGTRFSVDDGLLEVDAPLAYVNRFGIWGPDGEPVALAAVPARDRRFAALTQRELLDRAAPLVLGEGTDHADLQERVFAGLGELAPTMWAALHADSMPFDHPGWRPMAPDGTLDAGARG